MPGKLLGDDVESALQDAVEAPVGLRKKRQSINSTKTCIMTTHDEAFNKQDVLVRPDLFISVPGQRTILQLTSVQETSSSSPPTTKDDSGNAGGSQIARPNPSEYVFTLRDAGQDVLSRLPTLEISLLASIANALGFRNRTKVIITEVDEEDYSASHVEIAFKDAFLTRADLWRLLTSDLVGTTIYKHQKVLFINSVKANLKAIYVRGRKVQSALMGGSTKAIFRSESSGYYILLQMSKEMWDFDADGGGEIMFNKVINGFLPELFRRWQDLGTTHTVSVVLFTRMQYESDNGPTQFQDFYRVLTTELVSGDTEAVLHGLKLEWQTFLRDISITQPDLDENGESLVKSRTLQNGSIRGRPASAINGNILEAIHTASLQFLRSNVTADLRRTGLSLIVITPGPGVFEVSHDLLIKTTDLLIENGIYIDLVCLSKMPLHSSPLFKYKTGRRLELLVADNPDQKLVNDEWQYAIPHWVDVSFWEDDDLVERASQRHNSQSSRAIGLSRPFIPRVRMYEIQMMGLMQNEFSITMPYLAMPLKGGGAYGTQKTPEPTHKSFDDEAANNLEGAKAVYNRGDPETGTSSPPSNSSHNHLRHKELLDWMDAHDEDVQSIEANRRVEEVVSRTELVAENIAIRHSPHNSGHGSQETAEYGDRPPQTPEGVASMRKASFASTTSRPRSLSGKPHPFSRQLSYNFKGFGAAKASATTSISTSSISVQASSEGLSRIPGDPILAKKPSSQVLPVDHDYSANSTLSRPSTRASGLNSIASPAGPSTPQPELTSRPIDIRPSAPRARTEVPHLANENTLVAEPNAARGPTVRKPPSLLSAHERAKTPWLTVLNPANPKQLTGDLTSRLGRWQHVFPRPCQTSTIKWKSLCSPAVLPLTTEDFPTREQLTTQCSQTTYIVSVPTPADGQETGKDTGEWLVRELIASRLTRGFSVVVGSRPAEALGLPKAQWYEFLHEKGMSQEGVKIIMSRGKEIHKLLNREKGTVEVTRYLHKSSSAASTPKSDYRPLIRTAYASNYAQRSFHFLSINPPLDWERLDRFIATSEEETNKPYPESLQYWRARFVLIPIALSVGRSRHRTAEENEEEKRLEGIRKLTQMWQKNRSLSPNERKFESSHQLKKDANPLDLVYQTRSASLIVAELSDTILADGNEQRGAQLLPESELFEEAKLNLSALAKAMQGDRGVRLMDRRWHWRLHYYCFIGLEFVTWLVNNFRDIDTRDEAVELGNKLMTEGLFVHVEKRHEFRDGNFFYQITERFREHRHEPKPNWLSRLADRASVPPTPITESPTDDTKQLLPISSTDSGSSNKQEAETFAEQPSKPRPSVILSKQLVYDMDHRKKSHRRELVNLHVDRICSADECYHMRIDWVTATPKLIEDTIENWASLAERSGLRLVEVPLLEASRFRDLHPFRHPYEIKLATPPPTQQPRGSSVLALDGSKSVQSNTRWPYHKAILKKFDFVLDLEAASDFPSSVDVSYSWGKPDYRFAQYITRNGRLLAQITDEGHLLLLLNQLYTERGAAAREAQRAAGKEGASRSNANKVYEVHTQGPGGIHHYSHHPYLPPHASSPLSLNTGMAPPASTASTVFSKLTSPFSSPMLKAVGVGGGMGSTGARSPRHSPCMMATGSFGTKELMNLHEVRDELDAFCSDVKGLERFYEEEMHRPPATVPATPLMHPTMLGLGSVIEEGGVPALSLK